MRKRLTVAGAAEVTSGELLAFLVVLVLLLRFVA